MKIIFMGAEIELEDVDYSPGCAAKTSGPPENCYPAEDAEITYDINAGCEAFNTFLEENFEEEIIELALEAAEQAMIDQAEDAADQRYQQMKDDRLIG